MIPIAEIVESISKVPMTVFYMNTYKEIRIGILTEAHFDIKIKSLVLKLKFSRLTRFIEINRQRDIYGRDGLLAIKNSQVNKYNLDFVVVDATLQGGMLTVLCEYSEEIAFSHLEEHRLLEEKLSKQSN